MQSEQIINILHIGFIICLVLTILFAALSVFFFFQFKIRDVFNAITGRAQRKSVQQMEEENAKTGKLRQDYYSTPTSSDLYTTPSGRIPPVMSAQQAAGGQADGAAYTEQVYHSADPEGREHTMQLHTAQQAASDNGCRSYKGTYCAVACFCGSACLPSVAVAQRRNSCSGNSRR